MLIHVHMTALPRFNRKKGKLNMRLFSHLYTYKIQKKYNGSKLSLTRQKLRSHALAHKQRSIVVSTKSAGVPQLFLSEYITCSLTIYLLAVRIV